MPYCPNCDDEIAANVSSCPTCEAVFGPGSGWQPLVEPPADRDLQRIAEFRAATERRRQERELEIPAGESEAGDPVEQHEWKVRHWALAFLVPLVFFLAASGWASPRNKNDQGFLNAVIGLQALFGGLLIRTLAALFHWESALAFVGKVLAIVVLGVALSGLTMCSYLATHPWGF